MSHNNVKNIKYIARPDQKTSTHAGEICLCHLLKLYSCKTGYRIGYTMRQKRESCITQNGLYVFSLDNFISNNTLHFFDSQIPCWNNMQCLEDWGVFCNSKPETTIFTANISMSLFQTQQKSLLKYTAHLKKKKGRKFMVHSLYINKPRSYQHWIVSDTQAGHSYIDTHTHTDGTLTFFSPVVLCCS